jgi:hypothetical protein
MKKLLILSVLFVSLTLSAQVREFAISAFDNSIVREVNDTTVLIYAEESPTNASFLLYKEGTPMAKAFTLPNNLHVRDVRIWKGELAYFCGTCDVVTPISTKKVLVGWFDISGVFSGTDWVRWSWFDTVVLPEIIPLGMRRLDLFEVGGTVCMAMVGDAVYIGDTIATLMSAYNVGANWQAYTMVHKGTKKYTDIVCLDNMVAAVGTYQADTGCVVNTFWPTLDFPAQSCYPYTAFRFTYGASVGRVLVAKEQGDVAVLAHYDNASGVRTVLQCTVFDATGKPALAQAQVTTPPSALPYDNMWRMQELSVYNDTTYLLQCAEYSVLPGMVNWRVGAIVPSSLPIEVWAPYPNKTMSMDVLPARWVTTDDDNLCLHGPIWPSMSSECVKYGKINVTKENIGVQEIAEHPYAVGASNNQNWFNPVLFNVKVEETCRYERKTKTR